MFAWWALNITDYCFPHSFLLEFINVLNTGSAAGIVPGVGDTKNTESPFLTSESSSTFNGQLQSNVRLKIEVFIECCANREEGHITQPEGSWGPSRRRCRWPRFLKRE